jgi:hypothetical protein
VERAAELAGRLLLGGTTRQNGGHRRLPRGQGGQAGLGWMWATYPALVELGMERLYLCLVTDRAESCVERVTLGQHVLCLAAGLPNRAAEVEQRVR